jgi:protein-L-isoaspartate(D-aspartate) O-methyltransferase
MGETMPSIWLAFVLTAIISEAALAGAQCARERDVMVEIVRAHSEPRHRLSERVLQAIAQTERHRFAPGLSCQVAYADRPVSIGAGQTMSQPFIVALMTELARVGPDDTVLEVGTGSGYQAAILSRLARKVCTIEIIASLGQAAAKALKDLGHDNVSVKIGDGYRGWPECAPFDAIIVTAAASHVPPPLVEQLKVGGRLVMPVGYASAAQQLVVVEKTAPGETTTRSVALVRFVPFTGPQR